MLLFALFLLIIRLAEAQASPAQAHEYIRVVQEHGVWWLRDGSGHNFFSLGVNCVGGCYGHAEATPIPPARKTWIVSLLQDWGFNTAACWSSPSVWDDMYVVDQIYPGFIPHQHDVFEASFWHGWIMDLLRNEVKPFLQKKNFIGYFLDNEPAWNDQQIFAFYLRLARHRPGSRALVAYLKLFYQGSIQQLNRAWGTSYASFDNIPGTRPPKQYSVPMRQGLLKAWRIEVVATYYRRYAAIVRALDPDHLILGIRYQGVPDMDLFKALTPYFDVNSINDYNRYGHVDPAYAALYEATGKPLMLTEFSFSGFPHPGYQSALFVDVYTQDNRGRGYHKYVLQAARAPFMVGMHWFMWMDYTPQDQAMGGHLPDKNVGLVSSDETMVHEELGQWIKRTNASVDATHRNAHWMPSPVLQPQRRVLQRFVPTLDGHISEWPPELALRPTRVKALAEYTQAKHTYFVSWDAQHLYLAGDIAGSRLESSYANVIWDEGDYLSIHLSPAGPSNTRSGYTAAMIISPIGGGADKQQPYATRWLAAAGYRQIALQVKKRLNPGGYTIEARIPARAVAGLTMRSGTAWNMKLTYQNVNEIYQTHWEGVVTLQP